MKGTLRPEKKTENEKSPISYIPIMPMSAMPISIDIYTDFISALVVCSSKKFHPPRHNLHRLVE